MKSKLDLDRCQMMRVVNRPPFFRPDYVRCNHKPVYILKEKELRPNETKRHRLTICSRCMKEAKHILGEEWISIRHIHPSETEKMKTVKHEKKKTKKRNRL